MLIAVLSVASSPDTSSSDRRLMLVVCGLGLFLLTAELFGVGRAIAEVFRRVAHTEGWYEDRRPLQAALILGLLGSGLAAAFGLLSNTARVNSLNARGTVVGMVALSTFVAVRSVSLHQVDGYLYRRIGGTLTFGSAIEVCLIAATVLWLAFCPRPRQARSAVEIESVRK